MKFLAITRDKRFSPNMQDKDRHIIEAVKHVLENFNHTVSICDEHSFYLNFINGNLPQSDAVFTMLRSEDALQALDSIKEQGLPILNPPQGIRNAQRKIITKIMADNDINMPHTVFNLGYDSLNQCLFPCWIKRGEGWALNKDDVRFAADYQQAQMELNSINENNIKGSLMAAQHIEGDLVKFYGVQNTDFFFAYYPDINNTKFRLEKHNGEPHKFKFDVELLKCTCNKIATISQIFVYGGDCIVTNDGHFYIIDFNDWPSFSPCQTQAAKAIADRILMEVNK